MDLLNKFTMKDVIYLAAEGWEEIQPSTLQKSWKKLWPNMPLPQESEQAVNQPANDAEFVQVSQRLEGCAEVEETIISKWIYSDIGQVLNEDKIIAVCTANIESDSSEDEDDTDKPISPTHGEPSTML